MHQTIRKFGYPETLLRELAHWVVLVRPAQATLGSLVLACREEATQWSQLSAAAQGELAKAVREVEATLKATFAYDKINYLMLMMTDPHVHFHVVPRYASPRSFAGQDFEDAGWPGQPILQPKEPIQAAVFDQLHLHLKAQWHKLDAK